MPSITAKRNCPDLIFVKLRVPVERDRDFRSKVIVISSAT